MNHYQIPQLTAIRLSGAMAICPSLVDGTVVDDGPLGGQAFCRRRNPLFPVVQTVGFGLGKSEMPYLSMEFG